MQVKKQQLELDIDQQTASKLGKEYAKHFMCVYFISVKQIVLLYLFHSWVKYSLARLSNLPGSHSWLSSRFVFKHTLFVFLNDPLSL